jgi:hypothetical protein
MTMTSKFQHPNIPLTTLQGTGEIIDTVVTKNIQLSDVTVPDILDSDHLPIFFTILDHVRAKDNLNRVEKFRDWEWFPIHLTKIPSFDQLLKHRG